MPPINESQINHHVADTYIALFSHFIPCGVWEAIYILEGLLKNTSEVQPTTIHGDTQAQSTPVFGLAHLLGIKPMPRIRNWKDLRFFRPSKDTRYRHIDNFVQRHNRLGSDREPIGRTFSKWCSRSKQEPSRLRSCFAGWVPTAGRIASTRPSASSAAS